MRGLVALAFAAVVLAGCGTPPPPCHQVRHAGRRVCVTYRREQVHGDPVILIPVYRPAPPPAEPDPEEHPVVDDPVSVDG